MDLKQFKLANGEEIVCEVVEWHDDEMADIIIRNSYKIIAYHGSSTGDRYYSFAPWMVYQEGNEVFQSINADLIVGSATPTEAMVREYLKVKESDKATQEEIDRKLNDYIDNIQKMLLGLDKESRKYELLDSDGKVVAFPDRGKIH
jgi:hypothetical protein